MSLDERTFVKEMTRLAAIFSPQTTTDQDKDRIRGAEYYKSLKHSHPQDLTRAVDLLIDEYQPTLGNPWFPVPGKIKEYVRRAAMTRQESTPRLPDPGREVTEEQIAEALEKAPPFLRQFLERNLSRR